MPDIEYTVDDFSSGLNLVASPASLPRGGMFRATNFFPRSFGLERKSGYRETSAGLSNLDLDTFIVQETVGGGTLLDEDAGVELDEHSGAQTLYGIRLGDPLLRGATSRLNRLTQTLEVYALIDADLYQMKHASGVWTYTQITDGTDPVVPGTDLGRPAVLFDETDMSIPEAYRNEKRVTLYLFRGDLWMARRGFPMRRYRPRTNLFYAVPANAPRPGVVTSYEGFLMCADLGSYGSIPETPNGIRWSARNNPDQWDDAESVTAGFKIPSQCPSRILAACPLHDELLFFHEGEIHAQRFIGGAEILRTKQITDRTGVAGPNAVICSLENAVFIGDDNIYLYSRGSLVPVDTKRKVRDEIFTLSPEARKSAITYYDRANEEISWYLPGTEEYLVFVLNFQTGGWTRLGFNNSDPENFPVLFIDVPAAGRAGIQFLSQTGKIFALSPDYTTEDGTPFTSSAEFMLDLGTKDAKTFRVIEIDVKGTGQLEVSYAVLNNSDADPATLTRAQGGYITRTLNANASQGKLTLRLRLVNSNGKYLALRFSTQDDILIRRFTVWANVQGEVTGGTGGAG